MDASQTRDPDLASRVPRRVAWRLMPYLLTCFLVAFLDRANVSYAGLQMTRDLGFTEAVYGLGAGLFFVGYFMLEIPGSVLVESWSARRWFARILVTWGLCASACGFVHGRWSFYALRLLLGACEAGFAPGVFVYLGRWFPPRERARATALFLLGAPLSGILGAPVSGLLLGVHWLGLPGWRWVFLAEGMPALLLGVAGYFLLTDYPHDARWLSRDEREWLEAAVALPDGPGRRAGFGEALSGLGALVAGSLTRPILRLVLADFLGLTASYGLTLWMPLVLKSAGARTNLGATGLVAVTWIVALVALLLIGRSSDRTGERTWHTVLPLWAAAAGLAGAVLFSGRLPLMVACLCVARAGLTGFAAPFWGLLIGRLRGRRGAAAIGLINALGNLGGFAGPYVVGLLKTATHSYGPGLGYLVASAAVAGVLCLGMGRE